MKRTATNRARANSGQLSRPAPPILFLGLAGCISLAAAPGSSLAADPAYTVKVLTAVGSAAPGGGAFVSDFEPTALNNRSQLAFTSEPEVPGEEAVFLAGGGAVQQIMRFGQSAPGGGTFSVFEMGNIGLNDSGDIAFDAATTLADGSVEETVFYYSGATKQLRRLAGIRTVIPGYGTFVSLEQVGALVYPGCRSPASHSATWP